MPKMNRKQIFVYGSCHIEVFITSNMACLHLATNYRILPSVELVILLLLKSANTCFGRLCVCRVHNENV